MEIKSEELLYTHHPLVQAMQDDASRFKVICCGRRFGKTTFGLWDQFETLQCFAKLSQSKTRGLVLSPTYKLVEEDWRILHVMVGQSYVDRNIAELSMDFGAYELQMLSTEAEYGVGRGGGFHHVLFDEAARIPERIWLEEVRPAISDTFGRATFISTPRGRNWFYRLWLSAHEQKDWSAYQHSTLEGWRSRYAGNPVLLAQAEQEWEQIKATTPEKTFREEYMAEFVEHEGQFLRLGKVLRGMLRPALPGRHYIAGLDVARVEDWMVTLILEVESHQVVGLVRSRHRAWETQKATALGLLRQYPHVRVLIDSTGVGDPIAQDLRAEGVDIDDVKFTAKVKQELVENLTVALEQGLVAIPDQAETVWLLEELRSYEERQSASGHITYSAPAGLHDDGVTALMLACWGLRYELQQPVVDLQSSASGESFTFRDFRLYEERLQRWQRQFPDLELPMHPRDIRFAFNEWRR